jgi:DNA-binding transcriptional MerR regulator
MSTNQIDHSEPLYRIGAVSRLTGISEHTLRMWERRYQSVRPHRTESGSRLYTRDDVGRLALIKRIVDAGNSIGTVANLDLDRLEAFAREISQRPGVTRGREGIRPCTAVVYGDALKARLADSTGHDGFVILGAYNDPALFEAQAKEQGADVLVIEMATLHEETAQEIDEWMQRTGVDRAVVVYAFGANRDIQRLDSSRVTVIRAPIETSELALVCRSIAGADTAAEATDLTSTRQAIPDRRFSQEELGRFAQVTTTVKCECPHHLTEIIYSLNAFETYSQECENRNLEDATLHTYLHTTTAHARAMMEEALEQVAKHDRLID